MEKPIKQSSCVILLTLTLACGMGGLIRAEFADAQEMRLAQASGVSQHGMGNSLIMTQVMPQPKAEKKKEKKEEQSTTRPSDRMDIYQCVEYCAVVRQSCEGLATIQPDTKIARIGSKESSKWSRECQKIYNGCQDQCDIDDSKVQWKRLKEKKDKKDQER